MGLELKLNRTGKVREAVLEDEEPERHNFYKG